MKKDLKKIVMIGPVYPYKGGIAHYTGLMCKALRKKYDVTMVSFQMQYPKFLYKKEQKFEKKTCFFESSLLKYHSARWKIPSPA